MPLLGFVVAMLAQISPSPTESAFLGAATTGPHWVILCRWGEGGRHVTLAHAQPCPDGGAAAAPAAMHPQRTLYGAMAVEDPEEGTVFLLARALPRDLRVAGGFVPADGYLRLEAGAAGTPRLVGVVRPLPAGEAEAAPARALHIVAERRPWAGEILDLPPG